MMMPTYYSTFLNKIVQKQQDFLPSCRSIEAEYIWGTISDARLFLVGTDTYFVGTN